ncbi:hypothetical protein L218DRAFT_944423 [Marasmius fiardii PR-910]|nr:hypothetical protein L218DRAFT_944423 [Marasmius fiardii PR-910]
MAAAAPDDILSWTNQDPRESQLFNSWGVLYRFQTVVNANGTSVTTLWRAIRATKEDRVAKLEWASNGGLGRIVMGKSTLPMADLVRRDPQILGCRVFNGPDGQLYRWRVANNGSDILVGSEKFIPQDQSPMFSSQLQDQNNNVLAFYRPTRPTRYQIGDVYGELHFIRSAGAGTVMHPPIMDMVTVTAMLYRFCAMFNL